MRTIHRRQFLADTGAALGVGLPFSKSGWPEKPQVQENHAAHKRSAYELEIHPEAGIVRRLNVPTDPPGINLIHLLGQEASGRLPLHAGMRNRFTWPPQISRKGLPVT